MSGTCHGGRPAHCRTCVSIDSGATVGLFGCGATITPVPDRISWPCARMRGCALFGRVVRGRMRLNWLGRIVADEWSEINAIRGTAGHPVWQREFSERVVRNDREWDRDPAVHHRQPATLGGTVGVCGRVPPIDRAPTTRPHSRSRTSCGRSGADRTRRPRGGPTSGRCSRDAPGRECHRPRSD